ncbi:hypothetical protein [Paenibacillus protaetiae]|uniref:Uncharacterized protein n=1 Tax=Paenibacillus protaetiae TaxID=2509456 RepID=A0A4P6F6C9_9BACL|nr:hypothetical protein [Paenibacillus protaetiae]QAY65968.1 hypothetical protein ET464_05770 [Paenibacillus protaetiae]
MSYTIHMNLQEDWQETVKEVFRGSGYPLDDNMDMNEIGIAYFMLTAETKEQAEQLYESNASRLQQLEQTIREHFESVILPDIRKRTGYEGNEFSFKWAYMDGENIIEERSEYRIPI